MVPEPAYLAACGMRTGGFAALALTVEGTTLWRKELVARAHDIAVETALGLCLIVDRKPGRAAWLCRLQDGVVLHRLTPLPGHSFDGHAVFSTRGDTVFTTQSADGSQAGRIVNYNVASGTLLDHYSSHGIEPHELLWVAPGLLAIGNGGIVDRHAAEPIESSLVLVNSKDGSVRHHWVLDDEWETLSIRHLALLMDHRIVFAMQDQDAATDQRPMIGIASHDGALSFLSLPQPIHRRLDGYIGSVAVDHRGAVVAASAPRAGLALFWSAASYEYLGEVELADVCGLAPTAGNGFRLNSGHGGQMEVEVDEANGVTAIRDIVPATALGLQWDNHMSPCQISRCQISVCGN